jgi:hypothetical protein
MTDDQLLLANAYVDDELDADERAQAEADPEVMAEVARLRIAITALRDVEPADPARREAALAAAMRSGERPVPVAPPIPLRPRRAWWTAAGIAAAVVAILIGGAVVLQATSGGDDDDSSSIQLSADQPESAADARAAATTAATATTAAGAATTQQAADTGAASEATAAAGGAAPTTTVPARTVAPAAPAGEALTELTSPDDLIAFAMEATPQTPPPGACTGGRYVAPATYTGVTPAVTVQVFVDGTDAVARDAASCVEVVRAPLP